MSAKSLTPDRGHSESKLGFRAIYSLWSIISYLELFSELTASWLPCPVSKNPVKLRKWILGGLMIVPNSFENTLCWLGLIGGKLYAYSSSALYWKEMQKPSPCTGFKMNGILHMEVKIGSMGRLSERNLDMTSHNIFQSHLNFWDRHRFLDHFHFWSCLLSWPGYAVRKG